MNPFRSEEATKALRLVHSWIDTLHSKPRLGKFILISAATSVIVSTLVLIRRLYYFIYQKYYQYPPILSGIPYFGSVFAIAFKFKQFNNKILPKYGPITLHFVGPSSGTITINNGALIRSILQNQHCQSRPHILSKMEDNCGYPPGLSTAQYSSEYIQRRNAAFIALSRVSNSKQFDKLINHLLGNHLFPAFNEAIISNNLGVRTSRLVDRRPSSLSLNGRQSISLSRQSSITSNINISNIANNLDDIDIDNDNNNDYDPFSTNFNKNKNKDKNNKQPRGWRPKIFLRHLAFNMTFCALFGMENVLGNQHEDYRNIMDIGGEISQLSTLLTAAEQVPILKLLLPNVKHQIKDCSVRQHDLFKKYVDAALESYYVKKMHRRRESSFGMNSGHGMDSIGAGSGSNNSGGGDSSFGVYESVFDIMYDETQAATKGGDYAVGERVSRAMKSEESLKADLKSILMSAVDNIAHHLERMMLYLIKFPNLQGVIYQELKKYSKPMKYKQNDIERNTGLRIGMDVVYYEIDKKDLERCAYFRAFVSETMRIGVLNARGLPRALTTDCVVKFNMGENGECKDIEMRSVRDEKGQTNKEYDKKKFDYEYVLCKDFNIEPNFLYIETCDKNVWSIGSDPSQFDVNRWVKFINNKPVYIEDIVDSLPFSIGERSCVGQELAMRQLQSVIANIVLNYKLRSVDGKIYDEFDVKYSGGFIRAVQPEIPIKIYPRFTL